MAFGIEFNHRSSPSSTALAPPPFFFPSDLPSAHLSLASSPFLLQLFPNPKERILRVYHLPVTAWTNLISFRAPTMSLESFKEGKISGGVNLLGVQFYNNLINDLLSNGLQPYVTLFHWDVPQALEDDYGGFLSTKIVGDYLDYVDFCFSTFGDRVKHWLTLNEPWTFTAFGYATGTLAPGRCSNFVGNCTYGNSATEPYIVGHNLILSHAMAVKLYREKYKASQKGQIGITLTSKWYVPFSKNTASQKATQRALDFTLGWFLHPLTYGDYPRIMKSLVGNRLPEFTDAESRMIKKSYDFLGVNYYTSLYAANAVLNKKLNLSMTTDNRVVTSTARHGILIGQPTDVSWLYIVPKGIWSLTLYIKNHYENPPIVITENGLGESYKDKVEESLNDEQRIIYHYDHLTYLLKAIKEGVNVKGYFVWSFIDDFEWEYGYTIGFGINYVDYNNGLRRYPKQSSIWFHQFLQPNSPSILNFHETRRDFLRSDAY